MKSTEQVFFGRRLAHTWQPREQPWVTKYENHLDSLFEQLDNCGKHLTEWKTMDAFYRYKRAVKDVLSELAAGYQLVETSSLMTGSTHQTVQMVDTKLLELQQKLLQDELHHLEILDLIGELKGILVDRRG